MKLRWTYLETAVIAAVGVILIVTAVLSRHIHLLNAIYPLNIWDNRRGVLRVMMAIYGVVIVVASCGRFLSVRHRNCTLSEYGYTLGRSIWQEAITAYRWIFAIGRIRRTAKWLLLIVAIGAVVRLFFLRQPMRYDESYTFLNFVNRGFFDLFYYPVPNNHVLHTLLVRLSVSILGGHPLAIRLPAVLAGLLTIPLVFVLSRSLSGEDKSGFFAAALTAVFPYLILYDTMARGYSIVVLLSVALAVLGMRLAEHPSMRRCWLMALVTAFGALDIPSFLFPATGVFLWISITLIQRGHSPLWILTRILTPCGLMTIGLTGLLYTPVLIVNNGIGRIVSNEFVKNLSFQELLTRLPTHLSSVAGDFVRGIPEPLVVVLVVLLVLGFYKTARLRDWTSFALLPSVVVGSALVLVVKRVIPFNRTWIFLLPFVFILIDAGFIFYMKYSDTDIKKVSVIMAGCAAALIMSFDLIAKYPDTGHFPEAPILVDYLSRKMTSADRLSAICPADAPVHFYMWYKKVPRARISTRKYAAAREFIVIKPSRQVLRVVTRTRDVQILLQVGDAELYVSMK